MALFGAAVASVYVGVAVARPDLFMTVDGRDLGNSVEGANDGYMHVPDPCTRVSDTRWTCAVETDAYSGISGSVRVRMTSDTCWERTNAPRGEPLTGCVEFLHFMSPW